MRSPKIGSNAAVFRVSEINQALTMEDRKFWHVLQLTTGDETRCARALMERGVAVFLPMQTAWVRFRAKSKVMREKRYCMVPGYIFFQTPDDWGHIFRLRITHRLLTDDRGWPLVAHPAQMARFIASASDASIISATVHQWRPGDTARLTDGPFAGRAVRLAQIRKNRWVGQILGLFGSGVDADGDVDKLAVMAGPG